MPTTLTTPAGKTEPLRLTPLMNDLLAAFVADHALVLDLIDGLGSPLNVLFPEILRNNIALFKETFSKNSVEIGNVVFRKSSMPR